MQTTSTETVLRQTAKPDLSGPRKEKGKKGRKYVSRETASDVPMVVLLAHRGAGNGGCIPDVELFPLSFLTRQGQHKAPNQVHPRVACTARRRPLKVRKAVFLKH